MVWSWCLPGIVFHGGPGQRKRGGVSGLRSTHPKARAAGGAAGPVVSGLGRGGQRLSPGLTGEVLPVLGGGGAGKSTPAQSPIPLNHPCAAEYHRRAGGRAGALVLLLCQAHHSADGS